MNSHELTGDGSSTLYAKQFAAHYHSTHGALSESQHVFIHHGLDYYLKQSPEVDKLRILEFGFGTGLNALLAYQWSQLHKHLSVYYHSLEAYPITSAQWQSLNYPKVVGFKAEFMEMHVALWNQQISISDNFSLFKAHEKFEEYIPEKKFDVIFYDAFAPSTQAHLWEEEMLMKCYQSLDNQGLLVTFCAKGSFKRALQKVGFTVERLPGPPGKREMTRALKE